MKVKRFNEVNLNIGELDRVIKSGGTKGQKLVDRLKGDQNFTISQKNKPDRQVNFENPEEVVDNITSGDDNYDSTKAKNFLLRGKNYTKVFKGEDEVDYKLNDIKKDIYFGSSAGTSLGIDKTRIVESIQCLFLSLKQLYPMKNLISEDLELLFDGNGLIDSKIMRYVKIPIEVDEEFLRNFFSEDKNNWMSTFLNTANNLFEKDLQLVNKTQRTVFKRNKKYNFHQIGCDSELIRTISQAYERSDRVGIPISKWTPSDVWACDHNLENRIINELRICKSVEELNNVINSKFLTSQLVGLSLKKIGGVESIGLVINQLTPTPVYEFGGVVTSNSPFGSMGVKLIGKFKSDIIKSSSDTMYLRSFQGSDKVSNISGEVEGGYSRYGKIGLEWINTILKKNGILEDDLIPTKKQILQDASFTEEFLRAEIVRLNEKIPNKAKGTSKSISGMGSLISKYQSLRFGVLMNDISNDGTEDVDEDGGNDRPLADRITEDLFYYALSIKNYKFDCPMYVRIISDK